MTRFKIGDEVFTRNPGDFIEGASCIIGFIDEIVQINGEPSYRFNAEVPVKIALGSYEMQQHRVARRASEIGLRPAGIPIASLNGNAIDRYHDPDGWNNWIAVSQSWGHP